jgi:hypothetical protein
LRFPSRDKVFKMIVASARNGKTLKQASTLAALWFLLFLIIMSPTLRLGAGALHPREVQLGMVGLTVPKGWTVSEGSGRVTVSKPCYTIFCGSARAGFIVEMSKAVSEKSWLDATTRSLQRISPDATPMTVEEGRGMECVEFDPMLADGKITASCLNSGLHVTATFRGDPSLKMVFYQVLAAAHKNGLN